MEDNQQEEASLGNAKQQCQEEHLGPGGEARPSSLKEQGLVDGGLQREIEKASMEAAVAFNYDATEVEIIFDELVECEGLPDILKQKLFFLQSDQYSFTLTCLENSLQRISLVQRGQMQNQRYQFGIILQRQLRAQTELVQKLKEDMSDRVAEIRIMKRERDEERDRKIESLLEIKRLKQEIEKMKEQLDEAHQHQHLVTNRSDGEVPQRDKRQGQQNGQKQEKRWNFFGKKTDKTSQQFGGYPFKNGQPQQQSSQKQVVPKVPLSKEEERSQLEEQKEVIKQMQEQIQQKLTEYNSLREQLNNEQYKFAQVKGQLAELKMAREEMNDKMEVLEAKQKKSDEMLKAKDQEITNLKLELQKLRNTYEKDYKKALKMQQQNQTSLNTGGNMTTGGSGGAGDGIISSSANKVNQTFSFDPYSASSSKRNGTILLSSEGQGNPQPSAREIKVRESASGSMKGAKRANTLNQSVVFNSVSPFQRPAESSRNGHQNSENDTLEHPARRSRGAFTLASIEKDVPTLVSSPQKNKLGLPQ